MPSYNVTFQINDDIMNDKFDTSNIEKIVADTNLVLPAPTLVDDGWNDYHNYAQYGLITLSLIALLAFLYILIKAKLRGRQRMNAVELNVLPPAPNPA